MRAYYAHQKKSFNNISFRIHKLDHRYLFSLVLKEITGRKYILLCLNKWDKILLDRIITICRKGYFIYLMLAEIYN